ncbi:MAG: FAD-dependent oxidoreductase [Acidobacteriota bacterium]
MKRRSFLQCAALTAASKVSVYALAGFALQRARPKQLNADLIIVGGGTGGCSAALAAVRNGLRVIMTEETDWIGGQFTQQAVPPDEHPWIEGFGGTRTYREFRSQVREYYRRNYPLTPEARSLRELNPGNGSVSRLCHEPRVALAVLEQLLAPSVSGHQLIVLRRHKAISAETQADFVKSVTVRSLDSGNDLTLTAQFFIDATEMGELLPLTQTEYSTGFESQRQTQEPHAPSEAQPRNIQSFTCCFAIDYLAGENHTLDKPEEYDFWRSYSPQLRPAWPGKLLSWQYSQPITLEPRTTMIDPLHEDEPGKGGFWKYRRITDRRNFVQGTYKGDICLVNWPQNDYWLGNLIDVPEDEARKHLQRAKQLSLSLLFWMQTEAPRPDGGTGWPGLRLRRDVVGTEDGLAKYPYIRESRRIKAEFTVLEQHIAAEARVQLTGKSREEVTAESFPDSVGIGSYRIDLHPSSGGDNYIDVSSLPFQIPLGSLIPQRVENLLPGCKNLGVTHITNGCYRLHPVEWNIGESAGLLVAFALQRKRTPRQVRNQKPLLFDFQEFIQDQGVEITWPKLTPR